MIFEWFFLTIFRRFFWRFLWQLFCIYWQFFGLDLFPLYWRKKYFSGLFLNGIYFIGALMLRRYEPWLMMSNVGGGAGRGIFFRWLTYILKSKCDLQTFARFVFKFNNTEKKSIYYRWAYLVLLTGTSNLLKTLKRLKSFIVLKT